ncbi:nicotinate-nucleotide pyrophosphorylase [carboxylating], chloroplastic isoform X1 [Populus trichocarpa]|uniref:nicotinate-nucleotide pyrophosphorylase [carboxylating], chloroplastic isoform X1 n=1 Tax=Populus trichocarpa TaxID=3694 RepID=UPI000D18AD5A|nr:nicotinate-nucleotide pyrophosphorylase [carboxylating], chloroplastic isoform X1 [Populus trichocarpa]XP_052312190.1 nicotinate-nucleotide pyrophosphorylase [carboxylating], chloroplastic isoform X1 [Populus trichocarpa]|eukprot:XP_024466069.1 nicotinate-nucleotide pyrophosphorylase [carboxylating], chloroplastic isoform X1 [Populus trichocarpa]
MSRIIFSSSLILHQLYPTSSLDCFRRIVKMSVTETSNPGISFESMIIKPPSHPTYDLKGVIKLALAEDAGDRGDVTCLATIPFYMEVEAHFLAKEDGIIAGISLAEMIFHEVDPSLKVEWSRKDGDCVRNGLQFGKSLVNHWKLRKVTSWYLKCSLTSFYHILVSLLMQDGHTTLLLLKE